MIQRQPAFGLQGWYPSDPDSCRERLHVYRAGFSGQVLGQVAGLVPHAGWVFSGQLAASTIMALAEARPEVVFVFGGHMGARQRPVCMPEGAWGTPLGPLCVQQDLARELCEHFNCQMETPERFEAENTIELQLPIIKYVWPEATVVAVCVPPEPEFICMGAWAAEAAERHGLRAVAIGSTDLTHYGSNYGFCPKGAGPEAHAWSKQENDRPFIDHMLALNYTLAVEHALNHRSACCPGAAAATATFAQARGMEAGQLVDHTTSYEIEGRGGEPRLWVGYAGIVY
jgi:AmmeMemoRadiSam system protein B